MGKKNAVKKNMIKNTQDKIIDRVDALICECPKEEEKRKPKNVKSIKRRN